MVVADSGLNLVETDRVIRITRDAKVVLIYNKVSPPVPPGVRQVYQRSGFLHPVVTPSGKTLSAVYPADHPHQNGIFTAWVKTEYRGETIDFWNQAKGQGRVWHDSVVETFCSDEKASFVVRLVHRKLGRSPVDILRETWRVTVPVTDGAYNAFDLDIDQQLIAPETLTVQQHHYGGVAFRGLVRWVRRNDGDRLTVDRPTEACEIINSDGQDRQSGNARPTRWVMLTGEIDGEAVSIAVLCHPKNFRAPQSARLHPTKPYFCFAPCIDGSFVIDRARPFVGRYRYLILDRRPERSWLETQWRRFAKTP
jgi:hypothetical protein